MSARDLTPEEIAGFEADPVVEEQNELNEAFAKAQGEMPNAALNKINPHFHSRYADIASIRDATVPSLSKHGLGIRQFCRFKGDKLLLVTKLAHKSGQSEEGEYPVALDRPQAMGSSLTYARRYNWAAMCGVGSEEDDDANEAEKEAPAPKPKSKAGTRQIFEALIELMREASTQGELNALVKANVHLYEELTEDWQKHVQEEGIRLRKLLPE